MSVLHLTQTIDGQQVSHTRLHGHKSADRIMAYMFDRHDPFANPERCMRFPRAHIVWVDWLESQPSV